MLTACCFLLLLSPAPASSQNLETQPSPSPSPSPPPSPSPSPTPVTGLHQWGAVTLFHGLPSDRVHAIAQGPDGSMWFGTEAGLAKFDGRRTQTIIVPDTSSRILALQSDQAGGLWIGTDAGAARYIDGRFEVISEIAGNAITSIVTPEPGRVLLGTERGNVFECRLETDGTRHTSPLLTQPLESADREHPGPLIITSVTLLNNQLLAGSLSRGLLAITDGMARERESGPAAFFVRALSVDESGKLWVGMRVRKDEPGLLSGRGPNDLVRNDAPTGTVSTIRNIGHDVWVATDGNGVFLFSDDKKLQRLTFDGTSGGLRSDHVYAIFQDREEVVWFGTDRGVCRYDPNAARLEAVGNNSESNFIRTFYQTSAGQLLAGTNRGLFVYETSSSTWNQVPGLGSNIIYSLNEDNSGRLLVGSAAGFFVGLQMSPETKIGSMAFSRAEASSGSTDGIGSIRAITLFRGLTYIASYGRGVEKFDANRITNLWTVNSTIPRDVIALFADDERRLLVGTASDGVFIYDGAELKADPAFAKLKGSTVRSIQSTADKTLWFATNRGVYACKADGDCLLAAPGFEARFLTPDPVGKQNEIWCATSGAGLLKIRLDDQVTAVVSQLDAEQGLPSQNVFAVQPQTKPDGSESLLIGTSRGIARYRPDRVAPTIYATRVVSKRVHSSYELQSGLYLEYPQNSLLLDVAAINSRTFPEQFQYAFNLADAQGTVIKFKLSRDSQFTMEGLRPGKYRVTARAFSKDLIASTPLSFELSVAKAPFPWTSTALAILLVLALLGLIWAIMERRRIARTSAALVDANNELANARLSLANEAERERRRIARDLHDQTLADLRHLLMLSDQVQPNGEAGKQLDPALLRTEIESISQEVRRICEDLSPSVLQNVGFAAALEFALSHAVQDAPADKRFDYEFVCDEALEERAQLPPNVQMQIYRMVQEAVSNILRHAGATHVKMTVDAATGGDFVLQLQDNGRDFLPEEKKNLEGRGLANMRARASLIDAEISWEKSAEGGTVFTLKKAQLK
ncbi:MAG TPA: two-component regulator propeller domain-containing protein [Pyrinomonadaceae bacterium]|nr:two-component regulator propeller domain-containing protein [Pyrinomonadaceae bacterium]